MRPTTTARIGVVVAGFATLAGLAVPSALADSEATFTFTNNTGRNVDDLHIAFNTAVDVTDKGSFTGLKDNNTSKPTLDAPDENDGDAGDQANKLEPGDANTVKVTGQAGQTKVKSWYWTERGVRVSPVHKGCKAPDCTSP
ncbi:MAG: hypothetical protein ACRDPR_20095 [Nocardioidaceae bacterium]